METYFTSMTKKQTMLLLTAVTFGGQESLAAFEHLPEDEAELLKHRAAQLLQIPRDQRIPLLVGEMKRLVTSKKGLLWAAEPSQLARVLQRERPAMVEVLLRALPANLATAIRVHLPRSRSPAKREIKPEVLDVVRAKLDEILARQRPEAPTFRFADLKLLPSRELLTLCDRLGLKALGSALAGLSPEERLAFIQRLPPELRPLAARSAGMSEARKLLPSDAAEVLALHQGTGSPLDAIRSAGAQRLLRAAMAQSAEFAVSFLEHHRAELPPSFARWHKEERTRTIERGDGGRMEVVLELEKLGAKGLAEPPLRLPPPAKPALNPPTPSPVRSEPRASAPAVKAARPPLPAPALPPGYPRQSRPSLPPPRRDPIAERRLRQAGASPGLERPRASPPRDAPDEPSSVPGQPSFVRAASMEPRPVRRPGRFPEGAGSKEPEDPHKPPNPHRGRGGSSR